MSDGSNNNTSRGIGFFGALQVLFIGLKLAGLIDWPWWQVFLPLIVDVGFVLVLLVILGIAVLIAYMS